MRAQIERDASKQQAQLRKDRDKAALDKQRYLDVVGPGQNADLDAERIRRKQKQINRRRRQSKNVGHSLSRRVNSLHTPSISYRGTVHDMHIHPQTERTLTP